MKQTVIYSLLMSGVLATTALRADNLADAANDLCEHIKQCTLTQMNQEEITPEMRQMIEPMIANMCTAMRSQVTAAPEGHPLYQPATDCMRSMTRISCEAMQDGANMETAECKKYEEIARSYGGE